MSELGIKILINIIVGIIVFLGFFIFWGRSAGWFKKGGLVYEYYQNKKRQKKQAKKMSQKIKSSENDNPIQTNDD